MWILSCFAWHIAHWLGCVVLRMAGLKFIVVTEKVTKIWQGINLVQLRLWRGFFKAKMLKKIPTTLCPNCAILRTSGNLVMG